MGDYTKKAHGKHYYDCKGIEMIIGATQVIMAFFNSLLPTRMENVAKEPWKGIKSN